MGRMSNVMRPIRPIVIIAGTPEKILATYRDESGGTVESGWTKQWLSANQTDASEYIASYKPWKVGKNIWVNNWRSYDLWNTGKYKYTTTMTIHSSNTMTGTSILKALDKDENELGTIWTVTTSISNTITTEIVDLVLESQNCSMSNITTGADGGYGGPAWAFLIDETWSNSVTTDGIPPIVGGPVLLSDMSISPRQVL